MFPWDIHSLLKSSLFNRVNVATAVALPPSQVPRGLLPMRPADLLKRDMTLAVAISALVFMCALAWGKPFVATGSAEAAVQAQQMQAQQVQGQQVQAQQGQTGTFTGTVLRHGEQFVLRDGAGQIYRLDDPRDAQTFEGKPVKVTGKLDTEARLIHVERIEAAAA
jgi:uncharacterized protein YdeI (BOF family)